MKLDLVIKPEDIDFYEYGIRLSRKKNPEITPSRRKTEKLCNHHDVALNSLLYCRKKFLNKNIPMRYYSAIIKYESWRLFKKSSFKIISIDSPVVKDTDFTVSETLQASENADMETQELYDKLRAVLVSFPEEQVKICRLAWVYGLSPREIEAHSQVSSNKIKTVLLNCKLHILKELKDYVN